VRFGFGRFLDDGLHLGCGCGGCGCDNPLVVLILCDFRRTCDDTSEFFLFLFESLTIFFDKRFELCRKVGGAFLGGKIF